MPTKIGDGQRNSEVIKRAVFFLVASAFAHFCIARVVLNLGTTPKVIIDCTSSRDEVRDLSISGIY